MTWMEKMSMKLAMHLREENSPYTYGQLAHGIEIFLFTLLNVVALMLFSFLFHLFMESMLLVLFFYVLRLFSGGLHLKSPWSCLLAGLCLMLAGGYLIHTFPLFPLHFTRIMIILVLGAGFWINYRYAPAEHTYAPGDEQVKQRSRIIVLILLIFGCILSLTLVEFTYKLAMTFTLAVLLQSCFLLPITYRWVANLERQLGKGGFQ